LQGQQGTYFCGAWTGYGFHEDGLASGLDVAHRISRTLAHSEQLAA
jgi:predicted NAD/FAD-binding protein